MAAFGYLVYLLRANAPHRPKELHRLTEIGDNDDDLLDVLRQVMDGLGRGYHPLSRSAEGYRVKDVAQPGRTLLTRINRGPQGIPGEVYDLESEESVDTTVRQAQLSGLRAMFVVPENSYFGLMFVERIGIRHLKELLEDQVVGVAAAVTGTLIRVENFAELADWNRELSDMAVVRVSELLQNKDSSDDASTPKDRVVKVTTHGRLIAEASMSVKDLIVSRIGRRESKLDVQVELSDLARRRRAATKDAFTVQDEERYQTLSEELAGRNRVSTLDEALAATLEELVPVDRDELQHRRFDVSLGHGVNPERTFVIESNAVPQFVYEITTRLGDTALRNLWVAHAETIMANRGVALPAGWA